MREWIVVLQGMVRAEQDQVANGSQKRIAGLLVHGDAAFAGLGIVAECLQMANVTGNLHFHSAWPMAAVNLLLCDPKHCDARGLVPFLGSCVG